MKLNFLLPKNYSDKTRYIVILLLIIMGLLILILIDPLYWPVWFLAIVDLVIVVKSLAFLKHGIKQAESILNYHLIGSGFFIGYISFKELWDTFILHIYTVDFGTFLLLISLPSGLFIIIEITSDTFNTGLIPKNEA